APSQMSDIAVQATSDRRPQMEEEAGALQLLAVYPVLDQHTPLSPDERDAAVYGGSEPAGITVVRRVPDRLRPFLDTGKEMKARGGTGQPEERPGVDRRVDAAEIEPARGHPTCSNSAAFRLAVIAIGSG